jgi:hypothetical protein
MLDAEATSLDVESQIYRHDCDTNSTLVRSTMIPCEAARKTHKHTDNFLVTVV